MIVAEAKTLSPVAGETGQLWLEVAMKTEASGQGIWVAAGGWDGHGTVSPEASRWNAALPIPGFATTLTPMEILTSRTMREKKMCCFKPPSLWHCDSSIR
jgi:hypothetical protein